MAARRFAMRSNDEPRSTVAESTLNANAKCRTWRFDRILIGDDWQRDVEVRVDGRGRITRVVTGGAEVRGEKVTGWAVPGVPNVHSHSFQRALAGLAEGPGPDSFWSWREVMYSFLARLTPDDVEAITAQLYVELLKAGFTCVGEFHYLHHPPGGGGYDDPAEMSRRIVAGARTAGIRLVHLPAVYESGGFGGRPLARGQERFRMDLAGVAQLHELLRSEARDPRVSLGWALHSLRAVSPGSFRRLAGFVSGGVGDGIAPVHVHVAEQRREVRECLADRGARPVVWLLDHAPVDERWCLIHATHATEAELAGVARRGAVVGLCPTTEANLGDGLFPLRSFAAGGGSFGVGTDSHVSRSPVEELRLLEYGQRLASESRAALGDAGETGNPAPRSGGTGGAALSGAGGALLRHAWRDGSRALAVDGGSIEHGMRADLVVLDADHPALVGRRGRAVLDSWIFSGTDNPVRDVMVGGEWVVRDGRHPREEAVGRAYARAARRLTAGG
ncbi:MAG: formimidoylglutamate deiminase [Gemmatimonadetes bacterium]|nr:formimidoylglutamate deiminase [Gemmatimonadota bacterium]